MKRPRQFTVRGLLLFTLLTALVLGFIVSLPAILHWSYRQWQVGEKFDGRTFEQSRFALRITAFHERGTVLAAPGGFYRYEVRTGPDRRWKPITVFRLPRPEPIPAGQVRPVTGCCAYFFHGCVFGVTTDAGATWSIRGGPDNPPIYAGQTDPNADVEAVSIGRDGAGTMRLSNYDYKRWKPLPSHRLVTSDFGKSWKPASLRKE